MTVFATVSARDQTANLPLCRGKATDLLTIEWE